MSKWADYLITAAWKNDLGDHITHVLLHEDTEDDFKIGKKTTEADVIKKLKTGKTIATIVWDYKMNRWIKGAEVDYKTAGQKEYLRTHKNGTKTDNLQHMLAGRLFEYALAK